MAHLKNNVVSVKSLGLCQCLFANFSNKHYNRYNKHMRKMSIQCWDSNPRPLEHESPQQCDRIWRFIGLWSTIQSQWQQLFYPKRPTLLGNFCKGVKIDHFSTEIFFRQPYRHLAIFSGHTAPHATTRPGASKVF